MTTTRWHEKRVLITGGAGFIGSNLAEKLVSVGCRVRLVDSLVRGRKEYLTPILSAIEFVQADLTGSQACQDACAGMDVVFHLASRVGGIGYYLQKPGEVILQNSQMDTNMLQAVIDQRVGRYLYASSAHVYPIELQMSPDAPAIREEQAYPANPELSYGWAKLFAERQISFAVAQGYPVRAAIARLIGIFGKNQDYELATGSAIPVFCRRAIEYPRLSPFSIWGTGAETRSYCYIDDVLDGLLIMVDKLDMSPLVGPLNLGSEETVTMEGLARMIIDMSGKPIDLVKDTSKPTAIWGQSVSCAMARDVLDGWQVRTPLRDALAIVYRHIEQRLAAEAL